MARELQIYASETQWRTQVASAFGGAALATTATEGFFYVPACAGTPTGVPVAKAGLVPIVFDSVGHLLYAYSGGSWVVVGP